MSTPSPLLMIPGPVEVSPAVLAAASAPPPGHTSSRLIEAFGASLERMREVWQADAGSQPFILAGSGTLAMEMAAANLIEPGDHALVVNTGYFSDRMVEILRRSGAAVIEVGAPVGQAPAIEEIRAALGLGGSLKALFATHVDTSTGVRIDPEPLCRLARQAGALAVFDGVCATAGERFEMATWSADLYFTGSQKALGLPPGLALMVAGERALAARADRTSPPPLLLDWHSWLPIHRAYEERRPSYFATPATSLVMALEAGLGEIIDAGVEARIAAHARAAAALRKAWRILGLRSVPGEDVTGNTLSVLHFPERIDGSLLPRIAARGVTVAGGLHPAVKTTSFRVGHMGYTVTRPDYLERTVEAIGEALLECGAQVDVAAAVAAIAER
ncbi:MAG TPA: aminotransferase class V-fold PLP-dependent enzyme [Thermoanaerobaculia bacterium]|jgi:alanine-glyoxylate transaminase/serine-glyoxylate transaminase/serine-pyruvate transaminase|nr:aminotransferase class V-fold PLP-dependent enzyme [Thermoanaerobaculia bacterium]